MAAELLLSEFNRERLGSLASVLEDGAGAVWFTPRPDGYPAPGWARASSASAGAALAEHFASFCFLSAALCFRFAWVESGRSSAQDDEAVARMARSRSTPRPA